MLVVIALEPFEIRALFELRELLVIVLVTVRVPSVPKVVRLDDVTPAARVVPDMFAPLT